MLAVHGLVWTIPFVGLLLTIAFTPVAVPHLWHAHYGKLAALWAAAFVVPALVLLGPAETLAAVVGTILHEYLPFILLLGALFVVAGGVRLTGTLHGTPAVNTALLAMGTGLASVIGTTGAALLVIRPLVRANRHRRRATHVFVFFIFLAANIGGALSPLGDPPLLLGFLQGVPFLWPTVHLALPTAIVAGGLLAVFYALDRYVQARTAVNGKSPTPELQKLGLDGRINLLFLALIVGTVLLQSWWSSDAGIILLGVHWKFADMTVDGLLVVVSIASLALTRSSIRRANEFVWEPMIEVACLFGGIFVTLVPISAMIGQGLEGPAAPLFARLFVDGRPNDSLFYWLGGLLSAFLDSAPAYLLFFGFAGGEASHLTGETARTLLAISVGTVYFGAATYIGNAPNFMIRSIVQGYGLPMPSFMGYLGWSAVCLLPWLLLIDALFFR
jgi:Na+/H+ antiporter NhaD/arsenite permease-like protein